MLLTAFLHIIYVTMLPRSLRIAAVSGIHDALNIFKLFFYAFMVSLQA